MPLPLPSSDSGDADRRTPLPPPPNGARPAGAPEHTTSDDPAGLRRCTRCGKPTASDRLVQVSVGSHCVDCVKASQPDLATRARHWQAGQRAIVAYTLIAINVAVFVGLGLWYDLGGMLAGNATGAHVDYALASFFVDGEPKRIGLGTDTITTDGTEWYRLVTSGFLHFGILHLALNMYFLYVLGNQMEPQIGRLRFALIYGASLLGGSAGVLLIDQGGLTAGASGAVFGLLGALAVGMWQHGINPLQTQIGTLLLINLALTFFVRGISIGGHIGGLVAGAICGYVVMAPGYKGYPGWARIATPVAVGVAALAVSVIAAG